MQVLAGQECPQSGNSFFIGEISEWRLTEGHLPADQKIARVAFGSAAPLQRHDERTFDEPLPPVSISRP
jgi:hypothetical protein